MRTFTRTLLTLGTAAATLCATAPAAHAELHPVCTGTPANHLTYACLVHVHPDEAVPTFTVGTLGQVPQICVLNACFGPETIQSPGFTLNSEHVVVLWWNDTCYHINGDGTLFTEFGPLDANNLPVCSD